jgi:hypothetical protein
MSPGPSGLGGATLVLLATCVAVDWCERQAIIKTTGRVSASASIITRLILVLMFFVLFKKNFPFGSPPVTGSDNQGEEYPASQRWEAEF